MRHAILLSLLAVLLQGAETTEGTLELRFVTSFGGPVSPGRITIRKADGSSVIAAVSSQQLTPQKLPYGSYEITFEAPGWTSKKSIVKIDREKVFVTLAIEADPLIDLGDQGNLAVSVRAQPPASCTRDGVIYAKLVGAFSDFVIETKLSSRGLGLLEPVPPGEYVLIVTDGPKVRAAVPVEMTGPVTVVEAQLRACQ
jgi:hypothetical protein